MIRIWRILAMVFMLVFGLLSGCIEMNDPPHWDDKTTSGKLADVKIVGDKYLVLEFYTNQSYTFDQIGFNSYSIKDYIECNKYINQSVIVSYTHYYVTNSTGVIVDSSLYFKNITEV